MPAISDKLQATPAEHQRNVAMLLHDALTQHARHVRARFSPTLLRHLSLLLPCAAMRHLWKV